MDNDATRAMPRNLVAEKYRAIHDKRSVADLHTLAHIKRFLECCRANPQFRDKLQDNTYWPSSLIDAYGIDVDPRELLPLFHPDFRQFRFSEEVQRWPAAQLWLDYKTELATCADAYDEIARCTETIPRF